MKKRPLNFGQAITELRRERGLNQRELAAKVRKQEGGVISQQYLNDIENGRRNPSNDFLIAELARALNADPAYLSYLAGQMPTEIRGLAGDAESVRRAIAAFRAVLRSRE